MTPEHDPARDLRHGCAAAAAATICAMTDVQDTTTTTRRGALRFGLHYLEMVVAMVAGMVLLGPLWDLAAPGLTDRANVAALVMATDMAVGMAAWMRVRGHGWAGIAEMSAAMYLPFVVLLVPFWLGAVSGGTLMTVGHVLMLPLMAVAMLWRRCDYT